MIILSPPGGSNPIFPAGSGSCSRRVFTHVQDITYPGHAFYPERDLALIIRNPDLKLFGRAFKMVSLEFSSGDVDLFYRIQFDLEALGGQVSLEAPSQRQVRNPPDQIRQQDRVMDHRFFFHICYLEAGNGKFDRAGYEPI